MKVPLTGGAYTAHSVIASAQRSLNLYSEPLPENQTEPMPAANYPTPGTRLLNTVGTGPIRGIRQCTTGGIYVVSGDNVYSVNPTTWAGTLLGPLTLGLKTPVSMSDNGLDMLIVDGTANGWTVHLADNTMAVVTDPSGMFSGADRVDYLDTYFILNKPGTPQFYISGSLAVTFDPLDFANKESYSDELVTLVVARRELYLLGNRTTEIWYDAGATDTAAGSFPFAEVQGVFIDHGCVAKYSVGQYDNTIFWLSRNRQGQGVVMSAAGYQTKRISTYAIEAELQTYTRIDDAIGFCYQIAGHTMYVLTFPHADHTWCYDATTGLWHEWAWIDTNGTEHRHRANCFWPCNDTLVIGDWQNGNLYALDNTVFTDNGQPIKRVRSFPHMLADGKRVFYRQFLADMETGTSTAVAPTTFSFLDASFSAPSGTNLFDYTSDVGGGWTAIGGASHAVIEDNRLVGIGGDALYISATPAPRADYSVRFNVVPPDYVTVPSATNLFVVGRATGAGLGYRAKVTTDGTRYTLTLAVDGTSTAASVVMGTLGGGFYTVWLVMRGTTITAQVQRSQDGRWLRGDTTWQTSPGTTAAQFTDATYAAPGTVMVGGTWPVPSTALITTPRVPLSSDPNFPSGYSDAIFGGQTFDFARNLEYATASASSANGIAITDLTTMHTLRTTTMNQMYAGTPYGLPAGSPPSQSINDLTCGDGTDLYILTDGQPGVGVPAEYGRFTRVDATTLKVTGEFYLGASFPPPIRCVMGDLGVVNTTATHTIVAYPTNGALGLGPTIMDGTGMAPIGLGPTPPRNGYQYRVIRGMKRTDGSCDFIMLASDWNGTSGNLDIYRINVTDGLTVTSTHSTLNVFPIIPGITKTQVAQAEYDDAHDTIILYVSGSDSAPIGAPVYLISVNYDATVNWTTPLPADIGIFYSKGQSRLTGTSLMVGGGLDLKLIDTATGAITFTGSVANVSGSFYRVYDSSRRTYWTYGLATTGFTRISFPPSGLAMDDVVATTEAVLNSNLVSLRWSDDRAHSWGSPVTQDIGEAGEYRTSLQWQRLGLARDRCFEISWSVPMKTALQGCWVDVTPAQS